VQTGSIYTRNKVNKTCLLPGFLCYNIYFSKLISLHYHLKNVVPS